MRIIFFGTSDFSVPSLEKIARSGHELACVVTQPDRKKGRNLVTAPPPVKEALTGRDIILHQPEDVHSPDMIAILKKYNADLFAVAAFGSILKKSVLEMPKKFCVNLHASLLPKYRGASPVNWAVINADAKTGVTVIRMSERMDAGDIILSRGCKVFKSDTAATLGERLAGMGAELLLEALGLIENNKAAFTKQKEDEATYAHKLKKTDGLIDWRMRACDIHNRVRGLTPWPNAYTHTNGKVLKVLESGYNDNKTDKDDIGRIVRIGKEGIFVGTGGGELIIKTLQLEAKKRLGADEFLRGYKLRAGDGLE